MAAKTMANLSYGIQTPEDLFAKLKRDAAKLGEKSATDDVFNFLVTAASLNEWVMKIFAGDSIVDQIAKSLEPGGVWQDLPLECTAWIVDNSCVPNRLCDVRRHIHNSMRICWDGAGASKHFHWKGKVRAINPRRTVRSWYQYFFTSLAPDMYIDYGGENYGLSQIRRILVQFYEALFTHARRTSGPT